MRRSASYSGISIRLGCAEVVDTDEIAFREALRVDRRNRLTGYGVFGESDFVADLKARTVSRHLVGLLPYYHVAVLNGGDGVFGLVLGKCGYG